MKIHALSFGIAGGITTATMYTILGLLLKFSTGPTLKYVGTINMMPKLDYIKSFIKITPQAIVNGIATYAVAGFLIFWLLASLYNLIQKLFLK